MNKWIDRKNLVVIIQISVSGIVEVEYVDATEPMKNSVEKGIDSISARTAVVISKRKSVRRNTQPNKLPRRIEFDFAS